EHESGTVYPTNTIARATYRTPAGKPVPPHHWAVYDATLKIPPGKVTTYKDLCTHIGAGSPRSVGNALRENPFSPFVPCHRVVTTGLFVGGFRGAWTDMKSPGAASREKLRMLALEGVRFGTGGKLVEKESVWRFEDV
ncbi:methylated-DNA--cysteine S-met, partial [Vararia minispora EC-137]